MDKGELPDALPGSRAVVDPWLRLGAAALVKAYDDVASAEGEKGMDALLWLGLSDVPWLILDCLEIGEDPLTPIVKGRDLKNYYKKKRRRKREERHSV